MLNTFAMANLLKGEYKEAFTKIDLYGGMGNIENSIYEDRMANLYDIFMEAQEEGKPVEKIIGKDIEAFCKEYFKVEEEGHKVRDFLRRVGYIMTVIFIYSIIDYVLLTDEKRPFMERTVDLFPVVLGLVVGLVLIVAGYLVNKFLTFKKKKLHPTLYYIVILILFIAGIASGVSVFSDKVDILVPLYIVLIVSGVISIVYILINIIEKLKKSDTSKKLDKEEKKIKKEFEEEVEFRGGLKDVASGMAFRYKRRKKKAEKKGLEFTQADYAKIVQKEIDSEKSYNIFMGVLFGIFVIVPVVHEFITENFVNGAILGVILATIEILIYRSFVKFNKVQNESYRVILAECEEKEIDVVEYLKQFD